MARHLAHGILLAALVVEWLLLPHPVLAWLGTVLAFAVVVGGLVTWPRTQLFVPTVFRGSPAGRSIAFTFDDGPDPVWTPRVLALLEAHHARGTFFLVGERAQAHPELVARIAREGHEIGCHTQTHATTFHVWPAERIAADLRRAQEVLARLVGEVPRMFRPPQGIRVPQLDAALNRVEPRPCCVTWTARAFDSKPTTRARIEARLMPAVQAGHILTLHDGTGFGGGSDREPTLAALGTLLGAATDRGLACVSLSELLGPGEQTPGAPLRGASPCEPGEQPGPPS